MHKFTNRQDEILTLNILTSAFWSDNEPQLLTLYLSHNTAVVLPRCSTHSFYSHSLDPQLTDVT